MANVNIVNEAVPGPSQSHDHYLMWRLTREMLNAGWVIVEASDGTTKTVGSGWTTLAESQNANSWCALARPGNTTWGHLFWFRNVAALWSGVTPSAFQYYTEVGWDTSASTASTPPVANGGVTRRVSGNTAPSGARNWFGGEYAITNTHINIILKDDSANDDYSIIAWAMGTTNGSGSGDAAFPCLFLWSLVDGPVDTTTGGGDPYVMLCHLENSTWEFGGIPHPFGISAWRAVVNNLFENGTVAVLYRPNGAAYLHSDTNFFDIYDSPTTRYLEPFFVVNLNGSRTYRGFSKWARVTAFDASGDFFNIANESGTNNWVKLPSGSLILPWDGSTTSMQPYGVGTVRPGALMYAKTGSGPAITLPTITLTVPGTNPCSPQDPITVDYEYTGTGGTSVCNVLVTAWGDDGKGILIYDGPPATPGTNPYPTDQFTVTSNSDDGTTGQLVIEPASGVYWPITVCTWSATIRTDVSSEASYVDSQTVDAAAIPQPSITAQTPAPGSVISPNQIVEFDILDAILTVVYVQFAGEPIKEVVYNNSVFSAGYLAGSTRTAITGGYHYAVQRNPGWPGQPTFTATAADASGNVL